MFIIHIFLAGLHSRTMCYTKPEELCDHPISYARQLLGQDVLISLGEHKICYCLRDMIFLVKQPQYPIAINFNGIINELLLNHKLKLLIIVFSKLSSIIFITFTGMAI